MALVILNDDIAFYQAQEIWVSLSESITIEMNRMKAGNGDARKVTDLCNEMANIARQIDEQARKRKIDNVKQVMEESACKYKAEVNF